jgi:hypothetical protein
LQGLLKKLEALPSCEVLVVTPGGYASDPDDQEEFYAKNGFEVAFRVAEDGAALMIWVPPRLRQVVQNEQAGVSGVGQESSD